jgi:hypothetical protein
LENSSVFGWNFPVNRFAADKLRAEVVYFSNKRDKNTTKVQFLRGR